MVNPFSTLLVSRHPLNEDIYHLIASLLDSAALKCFRHACWLFADVGAKWLFREIRISFRANSFERLRSVSEHPTITRHVKSILYLRDVLWEDCERYEVWVEHTRFGPLAYDEEDLLQRHKEFTSLLAEHRAILKHGLDAKSIVNLIGKFPQLERISMIAGTPAQVEKAASWGSMVDASENIHFVHPLGKRELGCLLLGASKAKLKEIRAGNLDPSLFTAPLLAMVGASCESLQVLDLVVRPAIANVSACELKRFLRGLRMLRRLSLRFDPLAEVGHAELDAVVDPRCVWGQLSHLCLCGFQSNEKVLLDVISNHKLTLKVLVVGFFDLPDGSWEAVLPEIRQLNLDSVGFTGWLVDGDGTWLEGGEEHDPFRELRNG